MRKDSAVKIEKAIKALEIAQRSLAKDINCACSWHNHVQIRDSINANCKVLDVIKELQGLLIQSNIVEEF